MPIPGSPRLHTTPKCDPLSAKLQQKDLPSHFWWHLGLCSSGCGLPFPQECRDPIPSPCPQPHPATENDSSLDIRFRLPTRQLTTTQRGEFSPAHQSSTLTSAPRDATPGSRQGWTAGVLRSGSRCLWPVALNQMLGVKRGEPQSSEHPRYRKRWEKGFPFPLNGTTELAPHHLPESAGFAPDPPLLPLPQLSRPPGAKSWLLESINPG